MKGSIGSRKEEEQLITYHSFLSPRYMSKTNLFMNPNFQFILTNIEKTANCVIRTRAVTAADLGKNQKDTSSGGFMLTEIFYDQNYGKHVLAMRMIDSAVKIFSVINSYHQNRVPFRTKKGKFEIKDEEILFRISHGSTSEIKGKLTGSSRESARMIERKDETKRQSERPERKSNVLLPEISVNDLKVVELSKSREIKEKEGLDRIGKEEDMGKKGEEVSERGMASSGGEDRMKRVESKESKKIEELGNEKEEERENKEENVKKEVGFEEFIEVVEEGLRSEIIDNEEVYQNLNKEQSPKNDELVNDIGHNKLEIGTEIAVEMIENQSKEDNGLTEKALKEEAEDIVDVIEEISKNQEKEDYDANKEVVDENIINDFKKNEEVLEDQDKENIDNDEKVTGKFGIEDPIVSEKVSDYQENENIKADEELVEGQSEDNVAEGKEDGNVKQKEYAESIEDEVKNNGKVVEEVVEKQVKENIDVDEDISKEEAVNNFEMVEPSKEAFVIAEEDAKVSDEAFEYHAKENSSIIDEGIAGEVKDDTDEEVIENADIIKIADEVLTEKTKEDSKTAKDFVEAQVKKDADIAEEHMDYGVQDDINVFEKDTNVVKKMIEEENIKSEDVIDEVFVEQKMEDAVLAEENVNVSEEIIGYEMKEEVDINEGGIEDKIKDDAKEADQVVEEQAKENIDVFEMENEVMGEEMKEKVGVGEEGVRASDEGVNEQSKQDPEVIKNAVKEQANENTDVAEEVLKEQATDKVERVEEAFDGQLNEDSVVAKENSKIVEEDGEEEAKHDDVRSIEVEVNVKIYVEMVKEVSLNQSKEDSVSAENFAEDQPKEDNDIAEEDIGEAVKNIVEDVEILEKMLSEQLNSDAVTAEEDVKRVENAVEDQTIENAEVSVKIELDKAAEDPAVQIELVEDQINANSIQVDEILNGKNEITPDTILPGKVIDEQLKEEYVDVIKEENKEIQPESMEMKDVISCNCSIPETEPQTDKDIENVYMDLDPYLEHNDNQLDIIINDLNNEIVTENKIHLEESTYDQNINIIPKIKIESINESMEKENNVHQ